MKATYKRPTFRKHPNLTQRKTMLILLYDNSVSMRSVDELGKKVALDLVDHLEKLGKSRYELRFKWFNGTTESQLVPISNEQKINLLNAKPLPSSSSPILNSVVNCIDDIQLSEYIELVFLLITDGDNNGAEKNLNVIANYNGKQKIGGRIARVCCVGLGSGSIKEFIDHVSLSTLSPSAVIASDSDIPTLQDFAKEIIGLVEEDQNRDTEVYFRLKSSFFGILSSSLLSQHDSITSAISSSLSAQRKTAETVSSQMDAISASLSHMEGKINRTTLSQFMQLVNDLLKSSNNENTKLILNQINTISADFKSEFEQSSDASRKEIASLLLKAISLIEEFKIRTSTPHETELCEQSGETLKGVARDVFGNEIDSKLCSIIEKVDDNNRLLRILESNFDFLFKRIEMIFIFLENFFRKLEKIIRNLITDPEAKKVKAAFMFVIYTVCIGFITNKLSDYIKWPSANNSTLVTASPPRLSPAESRTTSNVNISGRRCFDFERGRVDLQLIKNKGELSGLRKFVGQLSNGQSYSAIIIGYATIDPIRRNAANYVDNTTLATSRANSLKLFVEEALKDITLSKANPPKIYFSTYSRTGSNRNACIEIFETLH